MKRWAWLVGLCACHGSVAVRAAVTASKGADAPAVGWTVRGLDRDLKQVAETTTDASGVFSLELPRASYIHIVLSGEGTLPISFGGETGYAKAFDLPAGTLWGFPAEEATKWRADFAGCPGADTADNGMIVGVTFPDLGADYDYEGASPDPNGFAYVNDPLAADPESTRQGACYLDREGKAYDATAQATGLSGRFAIFDVGARSWQLVLGAFVGASGDDPVTALSDVPTYVPEGGVAARIPAIVPLQ